LRGKAREAKAAPEGGEMWVVKVLRARE